MKINDVVMFFSEVDKRVTFPIEVVLTGGAAGVLYGLKRVTYDIDFEVRILKAGDKNKRWEDIQKVFDEVARLTRITPQYADDLDRWSAIALPSKKNSRFQKVGKVDIRLLDPALWAIGKLTRFLDTDISDLLSVLKLVKPKASVCVRTWGEALRKSPPSPAQTSFRKQVDYFLMQYAKAIWGKSADPEKLKALFLIEAKKR
jgi:hypothetical protein